jgi:chromate transporter
MRGAGIERESSEPTQPSGATAGTIESGGSVREVAGVALKLGLTAFGGPAAHIAMLRREVVGQRAWISDQYFVDLIGATNLIPGPNSTEMVIHVGRIRAGWRGLVVGGSLFILPAALMVLAFAWAYVRYGSTPEVGWLLYGVKPVIIAVVAQALWNLGRTALRGPLLAGLALAVLALYLLGVNEIALLFGGAVLVLLLRAADRARRGSPAAALIPLAGLSLPGLAAASDPQPVSLLRLFLVFLKIGSVLYGSGYVLLAFLRNDFVNRLGWLTDQQLLDAVAIGQFTPGPVFTTATFVGYVVGGFPGAVLATLGIFIPSFIFVALLHPLVPRLRQRFWTGALLDGVNAAAIGLMAAVGWELGRAAVVDVFTAIMALGALALLIRTRINSAWLVVAGGILGVAWSLAFR